MSNIYKLMVFAALALAACASPEEKAADAVLARQAADRKVTQIEETTEREEADVQRRANADISGLAKAGERRIADPNSNADHADNEATQALWEARERARDDASRQLDTLGQRLVDLQPALERNCPRARRRRS